MPDIDDVRGVLDGQGGIVLDGLVTVATAGKWHHKRFDPKDGPPSWVTTIPDLDIPPGTYRLQLRFGRYVADLPRARYDGTRFTGEGAAIITEEARAS